MEAREAYRLHMEAQWEIWGLILDGLESKTWNGLEAKQRLVELGATHDFIHDTLACMGRTNDERWLRYKQELDGAWKTLHAAFAEIMTVIGPHTRQPETQRSHEEAR